MYDFHYMYVCTSSDSYRNIRLAVSMLTLNDYMYDMYATIYMYCIHFLNNATRDNHVVYEASAVPLLFPVAPQKVNNNPPK